MESLAYMFHPAWLGYIFPAFAILTALFALLFFDTFRKKDKKKMKIFAILLLISAFCLIGWCIRVLLWIIELRAMAPHLF